MTDADKVRRAATNEEGTVGVRAGVAQRPAQRLSFLARLATREVGIVAALLIVAAFVLGFALLADEVAEGGTGSFDKAILLAFRSAGDPSHPIGPAWLQDAGRDVTSLGSVVFLGFVFLTAVGYLLLIGMRALAVLMSIAVLGGETISTLLKLLFERPRPSIPHGPVFTASFPSGHAMLSAVTYLTLGALLTRVHAKRRVKAYFMILAVFLTIAVGVSRVYLGYHFPTDVLAGWCLGAAWALLCWAVALGLQRQGEVEPPTRTE